MKKMLLAFISVALIVLSCNSVKTHDFTIGGTITKPPSKIVYLEKLSYENAGSKVVDSAQIASNGAYSLKAKDNEENLYVLSFEHRPAIIFINDGNNIKIDFNLIDFKTPAVTGSEATKMLYSFIHEYQTRDSMLNETYYRIENLQQSNAQDSTVRLYQMQGVQQINALNDAIRNYLKKSQSPAFVCFALDKARTSMQPQELNVLAQDAANRFKDHSGLAAFKNAIAEMAKTTPASDEYPLLNKTAPDITMNDVNGKPVSISNFRGKYLLVDFWASWCGPCRQENPNVVAAYNKFKNKNFDILGVSLDNDKTAWLNAIEKDKLMWTQISDLKQWESAAVNTYQFDGIPFNVLIDPQGKIIAESLRGDELETKLAEVLK